MSERVALVTGAARGIGRAIAVELARAGHPVAVNYLQAADDAKETLRAIEAAGGTGGCFQADVAQPEELDRLFAEVKDAFGDVLILVNNAGTRRDGLALSMSDAAWNEILATNLTGAFGCTRRALRPMVRARWGRIVNIASVAGTNGSVGQANYSAAKAGLIGLTKTVAREVAAKGITVNAVAPGPIATDLTADLGDERWAALIAQVPVGRPGTPEDVAAAVGFLCSDGASYVTGAVVPIDGGMTS